MNDINININQQNSKEVVNVENKKFVPWREMSLLMFVIIGVITSFAINVKPTLLGTLFWIIAFIWSGFLGVYAFQIHKTGTNYEHEALPIIIHQFIFNFGLALFGWVILWSLFVKGSGQSLEKLEINHLILLGVALVSLSGYLPLLISKGNPFK